MIRYISVFIFTISSCATKGTHEQIQTHSIPEKGSFAYDLRFLQKRKDVLVLGDSSGDARIAIVGDYQGRVMTSTSRGTNGNSYGWINYALIESGKNQPHINALGGEDRFWLGPEGGQFGIYFKKGSPFDFDHWQTPPLIDTEPYDLVSSTSMAAAFRKSAFIRNYQGSEFTFDIDRQIKLLDKTSILNEFGIELNDLDAVAFETDNSITNTGKAQWSKKTGLLSIWILGMYNPTDNTTIMIPFQKSRKAAQLVTSNYFGAIPVDRIATSDSLLLLRGDGRYRGKVGVSPMIAKNIAGSYDAKRHILTLIKFDLDQHADYVNSKWESQKEPYRGDVVNAYNDGPQSDGSQLGPFYELESSSPARELKPGETLRHRRITLHLEGDEDVLNEIAVKTLGVSLKNVKKF